MHRSIIFNHRGQCEINYCNLEEAINQIKKHPPGLVIIDRNLIKIYPNLINAIEIIPEVILLDSGEDTKTLSGVFELLLEIEKLNIHPLNHALVIGGATLQDTCGTAMSLLKRGTTWSYIPTTLPYMVLFSYDSSSTG